MHNVVKLHTRKACDGLADEIGMAAAMAAIKFSGYACKEMYVVDNENEIHLLFSESESDFCWDLSVACDLDGSRATSTKLFVHSSPDFDCAMAFDVVEKVVAELVKRGFDDTEMNKVGMSALEIAEKALKCQELLFVEMQDGKLVNAANI